MGGMSGETVQEIEGLVGMMADPKIGFEIVPAPRVWIQAGDHGREQGSGLVVGERDGEGARSHGKRNCRPCSGGGCYDWSGTIPRRDASDSEIEHELS